jgi:hypothetical protein
VRIDGLGTPNLPLAPAPAAPAAANAQPFGTSASAAAAAQALQLQEEKSGGGGGGHGAKKSALNTIDEIAARASLNIEARKKTMLDRMREIEKMKAEMAAKDERVGEKEPGPDDRPDGGDSEPEDDDPAA